MSSGLVRCTVPDVIMPIERLWMWGQLEQSIAGCGRATFSGWLKDQVSISPVFTTRQNEQVTPAVRAQPPCMGKKRFPEFCFNHCNSLLCPTCIHNIFSPSATSYHYCIVTCSVWTYNFYVGQYHYILFPVVLFNINLSPENAVS